MVPSFSVAGISASAPSFYIDHREMHKNSTITTSRLFDGISDLCSETFVL